MLRAQSEAAEEKKYKEPKVAESVPFDDEEAGLKGSLVLIQSSNDKEMILLNADNKVAYGYTPSEDAEMQKEFDELRAKFKTGK